MTFMDNGGTSRGGERGKLPHTAHFSINTVINGFYQVETAYKLLTISKWLKDTEKTD